MTVVCDEREYARLLGYPWGTTFEGLNAAVRERANEAIEWYSTYGRPRIYCKTLESQTVTAITAGAEVDRRVDELWEFGRVDEAYFLDRFAAAVVEKLAADLGPHRSPGTAGTPFEEQWSLFAHLADLKPEIEILPSGMLRPRNSLLAAAPFDAEKTANPCFRCDMRNCAFRRTSK